MNLSLSIRSFKIPVAFAFKTNLTTNVYPSWTLIFYRQLKTHFDAPGGPKVESLDKLADGLNRRKAARLFYQTCGICSFVLYWSSNLGRNDHRSNLYESYNFHAVLATLDSIRVEQHDPFGDILISRGPNMWEVIVNLSNFCFFFLLYPFQIFVSCESQ